MKTILRITVSFFCIFIVGLILIFGCFSNSTKDYIEDLKSENTALKNKAIYYLGKKREKRAVPCLIEIIRHDHKKDIKIKSIKALGQIRDDRSIDTIIGLLSEKDKDIKMAAVEALGMIKNTKAVNPLIDLLGDHDIQLTAIRALGTIGDKRAISALTKLIDHRDKYVRFNTTQSLKEIGYRK
jgi:HEAT repeat protein